MEGSAEEIEAPESWEVADLDASMSRMMLLSSKKASIPSDLEFADQSASDSAAAAAPLSSATTGIDEDALSQVDQFLREALEKPRERLSILRMEQDVEKFLRDPTQQQLEFQALPTSYLRLAAHRIAQHYFLQSLVLPDNTLPDGSGARIVLIKTSDSRFPAVRLANIPVSLPKEDVNSAVRVAIKQRPHKGSHNVVEPSTHSSGTSHSKTVEERKEEYNRARARIFSSSSGIVTKPQTDSTFEDSFQYFPITASRSDERSVFNGHESTMGRGLGGSSGSRANINQAEKEQVVSRYRPSNRVAIFRDHEVERKDPDYNRSYDRYMQRFDPGFGYSGGPYTIQPLFMPAVNYNTEFRQLGSGHRPQISIEHQPRPIPQHARGPWPSTSTPGAIGYGLPDAMMSPFNLNHGGSHPTSPIYMHSPQYSVPLRPGMSFVLNREHVQQFAQTHQQQSEASFGLARPR